MDRSEKNTIAVIIGFSFLISAYWCVTKGQELNGDEAVIGLMALKISQGADFPVFFWKAHYSGPISSYLAAPLHWIWEPSGLLLHAVVIPFHVLYCAGIFLLGRQWLRRETAFIAALFAALPAQLFPYSALGGFTEAMAFTPWIILYLLGSSNNTSTSLTARVLWGGFLCGLALWIFPVSLPVVVSALVLLYRTAGRRPFGTAMLGSILALVPTLCYNITNPGATILRLLYRPVGLQKEMLAEIAKGEGILSLLIKVTSNWADAISQAFLNLPAFTLALFGIGSGGSWYINAAGAAGLLGLLAGFLYCIRAKGERRAIPLAIGLSLMLTYGLVVFFGMNRYRYLIPALLAVPFGWALLIERIRHVFSQGILHGLLLILLLLNAVSNFWGASGYPPSYTELVRFLETRGLHKGYASYSIAYPLVYLSNERLIYTPFFHTPHYDRYSPYTEAVNRSEKPAYIFSSEENALVFRRALRENHKFYKEGKWQGITIFHSIYPGLEIRSLKLNLSE